MWSRPRIAPPDLDAAPFVRRWGPDAEPLPLRRLIASPRPKLPPAMRPPDALDTGPAERPFDFAGRLTRLTADIARRCPELAHLDASRIFFGYTPARSRAGHGLQARCTPMRFLGGAPERPHRGQHYRIQRFVVGGVEMSYLISFCLPRFLDRSFDDKLVTVFHELYHVSESFDGDLRRLPGRCAFHSADHKAYDRKMAELAREYLRVAPDPSAYEFLRLGFAQLCDRHGGVLACRVPRPKLIPVPRGV